MAKCKTKGRCALCGEENVELMQSHIIPKAVYARTKTCENSRFREYYNPKKALQDVDKKPMLCHECEEFFSVFEKIFIDQFLDKYRSSPESVLPDMTDEVDFYIFTVSWRILYDDLYKRDSYANTSERSFFEEFETKLKKHILERYVLKNPNKADVTASEPMFEGKTFGEQIAELERYEKSKSLEDMTEVKNYVFRISDLGFGEDVKQLFDSMPFGYSCSDETGTKYYVISGYCGLIIVTAYFRKRSIFISGCKKLREKISKKDKRVRQDLTDELIRLLIKMSESYPEIQAKLEENGLRKNIKDWYEKNRR